MFSAVFLCFSRGFLGFRGGKNSLVFWVVFLGIYLNTKEKKIREMGEIAIVVIAAIRIASVHWRSYLPPPPPKTQKLVLLLEHCCRRQGRWDCAFSFSQRTDQLQRPQMARPRMSTRYVDDFPKDPAVLKILQDSELLRRSVFTTPPIFTTS